MFNGNILRDAIISAANNIANNKKAVDDLNVFPVPDGDTGTNMSMSIRNGAKELARVKDEPVGKVAQIAASALLRGARGNSGVITSLLFRGLAKGFKDADEITSQNLAAAFKAGHEMGLKSGMLVTNPIPEEFAMPKAVIDAAIDQAISEANEKGIKGKETTPFLLARVAELTGDASLASNIRLVINNAKVAAQTAVEYCKN